MDSRYLILLDQAKAVDRGNHQYLFKVMEETGFKGDFLEITKMIYNKITSQVEMNGARTEHINITRGVRQGCPFSMLLFVLAAVPLIEVIFGRLKMKDFGSSLKQETNYLVQFLIFVQIVFNITTKIIPCKILHDDGSSVQYVSIQ